MYQIHLSNLQSQLKIDESAIVAARGVVVKDVSAKTIVGGNPAKPIGNR